MVLSGVPRKKSPVTPPGIDPGTVRLVAQCLNHYATTYYVHGRRKQSVSLNWYQGYFGVGDGAKRPEPDPDHPHPISVQVKHENGYVLPYVSQIL